MQTPIREILRSKPPVLHTIDHSRSVLDAATMMNDLDIGLLIVIQHDRPLGLLTLRHIVNRVLVPGLDARTTWISEIFVRGLVPVCATQTVEDALATMAHLHARYLPVCGEDGQLCGIVSRGDLTRWLLRDKEFQIADLLNYIRSA